jgi:hypothetical protein
LFSSEILFQVLDLHDPLKYGLLAVSIVLVFFNTWSLAIMYINAASGDNKTLINR